jgi:hypothetical protein
MSKKWVYLFTEGNKDMRDLLGSKGADLAEMTNTGMPIPPGFTITTEACNEYFKIGKQFPEDLWNQTLAALAVIEEKTGKRFGDPENPLLVSVSSSAKSSMPGMMDTVLNVGLNPETLKGIAKLTSNERFAWDAYRRLIQTFSKNVMSIDGRMFERILDKYKAKTESKQDTDLTVDILKKIVVGFKAVYKKERDVDFPNNVYEQLACAIEAAFASCFSKRAVDYRDYNNISHDLGTAVNVQVEDVVASIRHPNEIALLDHEGRLPVKTPSTVVKIDRAANTQRELQTAESILRGKIATGYFDVFLCHNSQDKPTVKDIGKQLKDYGVLPWLDEWELRPGLPWQRALEDQIPRIKAAAVFVGKEGIGPWQQAELWVFLDEFFRRGCPVIPVLLPSAPSKPDLPIFLRGMTWVDFRKQEPDPVRQLIWGITGIRDPDV